MSTPPQFESMDEAIRRKIRDAARRVRYLGSGWRGMYWIWRGLLWTIVVLAAAGFVRAAMSPPVATLVEQAVDERLDVDVDAWPADQAQQAAAAQVVWQIGADGTEVLSATPGTVDIVSDTRGTVTVAALVRPVPKVDRWNTDDGEDVTPPEPVASWRWLEVPITVDQGRVTVAAPAVDVAGVAPDEPDEPRLPAVDQQLTADTTDLADVIFAAWSGGSRAALDSVTDGSIGLLPGAVDLESVDGWQVDGTDTGAVGLATVTWATAGGGTSTQPYAVTLERDAEGDWQAVDIGPHLPDTTD